MKCVTTAVHECWSPAPLGEWGPGGARPPVSDRLRDALPARAADDVAAVRELLHDPIPEWAA